MINIYSGASLYVLAKTNFEHFPIVSKGLEGRFSFLVNPTKHNEVSQVSPVIYSMVGSHKLEKGTWKTSNLQKILSNEVGEYLKNLKITYIAVVLDLGEQVLPLKLEPSDQLPGKLEIGLNAMVRFYSTTP